MSASRRCPVLSIKLLSEKLYKIFTNVNNNTKAAYRYVNTVNQHFTYIKRRDETKPKS